MIIVLWNYLRERRMKIKNVSEFKSIGVLRSIKMYI